MKDTSDPPKKTAQELTTGLCATHKPYITHIHQNNFAEPVSHRLFANAAAIISLPNRPNHTSVRAREDV